MTYFLTYLIASPFLLWVCFYLLFSNYLKANTIPWYVVGVIGAITDVFVNVVIGSIIFGQLPHYKRLFLSARMDDLILNGDGWRKTLALKIVGYLLEPFDKQVPKQHSTYGEPF